LEEVIGLSQDRLRVVVVVVVGGGGGVSAAAVVVDDDDDDTFMMCCSIRQNDSLFLFHQVILTLGYMSLFNNV
jgi:hypothetical protein